MCLAIPAQVTSVDGVTAEVEVTGVRRQISIDLTPDVQPGDFVLVHTGYAISVIDAEEAEETLKLIVDFLEAQES